MPVAGQKLQRYTDRPKGYRLSQIASLRTFTNFARSLRGMKLFESDRVVIEILVVLL